MDARIDFRDRFICSSREIVGVVGVEGVVEEDEGWDEGGGELSSAAIFFLLLEIL